MDTFDRLVPPHLDGNITDGKENWDKCVCLSLTTSIVCEYAARTGLVCSLKLLMRASTASPKIAFLYEVA